MNACQVRARGHSGALMISGPEGTAAGPGRMAPGSLMCQQLVWEKEVEREGERERG